MPSAGKQFFRSIHRIYHVRQFLTQPCRRVDILRKYGFHIHNLIPVHKPNVSSTNYSTQYQRFRRTDVTISTKSLLNLRVTPPKSSPSYGRTCLRIRFTNPLQRQFSEIHSVLFIGLTLNQLNSKGCPGKPFRLHDGISSGMLH